MTATRKTLVIAGTREAHEVLSALVARGQDVVATLPELDRMAPDMPIPVAPHRFADAKTFAAWIAEQNPTHVIDAGHPFEDGMSNAAAEHCAERGLAYLRVMRPAWVPGAGDKWIDVKTLTEASEQVPQNATVLTNTGRRTQSAFSGFRGKTLYMRRLSPTKDAPPFAFMQYLVGPAPFSVSEEQQLFERLALDLLITRNVGGQASASKLIAARRLGMTVIMIARPPVPDAPLVETAQQALAWEASV